MRDKNWRPFYDCYPSPGTRLRNSLVDINIQALLGAGLDAAHIHVSCEDAERLDLLKRRWGVTPILCSAELCDNDISFGDWIRWTCAQVPGDDELIWSQVCDPLFDQHLDVLKAWPDAKAQGHDSLCVVYPFKAYLLDEHFRPIGWQWGEWHTVGQNLSTLYTFPFTLSILTRDAIERTGYHIGARPFWYVSRGDSIDIDTPADFECARNAYAARQSGTAHHA